jgi:hypothetical protein
MFEQLTAPDHVVAMRLAGKLTAEDVREYKSLFDEKLAKHKQIGIYLDMTDCSDMSTEAIIKDARAEFALLAHLNQFRRFAFVSGKEWPQAVVHFLAALIPTLEMKVFAPDKSEEAMKWAGELPEQKPAPPAFRFLPTSKDNVFAFEIDGVVSSQEMPGVINRFQAFLDDHESVRLLNRMKHFGGIDPAVFLQSGLVSMKLAAMQKVERYAIVGAPGWMSKIIERVRPAFPDMEMRTFPADWEDEAWAWVDAELTA